MPQAVKVSQAEAGDVRRGLVTWGATRQHVGETTPTTHMLPAISWYHRDLQNITQKLFQKPGT